MNYVEATDAILGIFKTAWDTTGEVAIYENRKKDKPPTDDPYCRVFIRHTAGNQGTLSSATGSVLYNREGQVIMQVFVPIGKGLQKAYELCRVLSDAYEGSSSGGVWFRNVQLREVGNEGNWFQTTVTAEFQYDELK